MASAHSNVLLHWGTDFMNILLWVLQILLALHTSVGAIWKFSNTVEETMPSIRALPESLWIAMGVAECLAAICLILPSLYNRAAILAPMATFVIAAEMLVFSGMHIHSGDQNVGPVVYWLVVTALCVFIAYGRLVLRPISFAADK